MTGSLLVAAYALLPIVLPDTPNRMYPWNHLPPSVGWALAVLALFVAQYRVWLAMRNERDRLQQASDERLREKDQDLDAANTRIRQLEDLRPRLSACLVDKRGRLLLSVFNAGATAKVSAKITITGDTQHPQENVAAVWANELGEEVTIATGDAKEILIAETQAKGLTLLHLWAVPFYSVFGTRTATYSPGSPITSPSYNPRNDPEVLAIRQRINIRVLSTPASLLPAVDFGITLVGCDIWENLSGVPICPWEPLSMDPSERWQVFGSTVDHLLAMFRGVKGQNQSLPEDWQVFKNAVREALSLSDGLDEPYREQARARILPFDGVAQSALDNLSNSATELQNWLTKTNQQILGQRWKSPSATPPWSTPSA